MSWHHRLQHALDVRHRTWAELVHVTGLTEASVYAWRPTAYKRTGMLAGDNAARVCAFLMINPLWLFDGIEPSGLENGTASHTLRATSSELETIQHLRTFSAEDTQAVLLIIRKLAELHRLNGRTAPE